MKKEKPSYWKFVITRWYFWAVFIWGIVSNFSNFLIWLNVLPEAALGGMLGVLAFSLVIPTINFFTMKNKP